VLDGIWRKPAAQPGIVVAERRLVQIAIPVQLVAFPHALEAKAVLGQAVRLPVPAGHLHAKGVVVIGRDDVRPVKIHQTVRVAIYGDFAVGDGGQHIPGVVGELILPPAPLQAKALGVRHCNRGILLVEHPVGPRHFQPVPGCLVGGGVVGFPGLLGDRQGLRFFDYLSNIMEGIQKSFLPQEAEIKAWPSNYLAAFSQWSFEAFEERVDTQLLVNVLSVAYFDDIYDFNGIVYSINHPVISNPYPPQIVTGAFELFTTLWPRCLS
jgi:hypothetical protein